MKDVGPTYCPQKVQVRVAHAEPAQALQQSIATTDFWGASARNFFRESTRLIDATNEPHTQPR